MKSVSRFVLLAFVPPSGFVFRATREGSLGTSPGARVPLADNRPGRNREFRHVRCESQTLARGFRTALARSCLLLPQSPTEECRLVRHEHSSSDFVFSYSFSLT